MHDSLRRAELYRVTGTVQGVGFRPFVWRLAVRHALDGWVLNDGEGVLVAVAGSFEQIRAFLDELSKNPPPAARIASIQKIGFADAKPGFRIVESQGGKALTLIPPDLALCDACRRELFDPNNRRYLYPFINCTNCGPRYTIILDLPYDRDRTTMRTFNLCPSCSHEYHDVRDRRFHAQPVACHECGPDVALHDGNATTSRGNEAITQAARALSAGYVVAVKGIGGYHLATNAFDEAAVARLRHRKRRPDKPLALMARSVEVADRVAWINAVAREALCSTVRPIVLLPKRTGAPLPDNIAPENARVGIMLPYTPLHELLFFHGSPELLVMTSGNRSSEPIAYTDEDALQRLAGIADVWLIGTRPIARSVDDSVIRIVGGESQVVRLARGFAPQPVATGSRWHRPVMAVGAMLKNSVVLVHSRHALQSQHLGDLDDLNTLKAFEAALSDLMKLYRLNEGELLWAHDLHPDYPSTRWVKTRGLRAIAVQHHRAHIASVLAEKDAWTERAIGFAFDGTGLGDDGAVWGGEVFVGSLEEGFDRVGHLDYVKVPGHDAAAAYPVHAAAGFFHGIDGWDEFVPEKMQKAAAFMLRHREHAVTTSSMGRLFDAVAAILGFHRKQTFEGQAAIWLESLALLAEDSVAYPMPHQEGRWQIRPLLEALLEDRARGLDQCRIARRFHNGLVAGVVEAARQLAEAHQTSTVVISGGVWQNHLLHEGVVDHLTVEGLRIWYNQVVPPNDGGIALGQAAIAQTKEP